MASGIARNYLHSLIIPDCVWIQGVIMIILITGWFGLERPLKGPCHSQRDFGSLWVLPATGQCGCDQVATPSPLTSVSPVLWTMGMKLIPHYENIAFLEGLSLFLTIASLSHVTSFQCCSLQHTVHTEYDSPACLFPNLDKWVALCVVSNMLWKLSAEKSLATQSWTLKGTLGGDAGRLQKPLNC